MGVIEGEGAALPKGNPEGPVSRPFLQNADLVREGDGEIRETAGANRETGDGRDSAGERASGAGADLSGVARGLKRFTFSAIDELAAENGGVTASAKVHDEMERLGCAARRRSNGGIDERRSARQHKGDGIGAGRGCRKKGKRVGRIIDANDAVPEHRKTEEEVDGESGGRAEVAEIDGNAGVNERCSGPKSRRSRMTGYMGSGWPPPGTMPMEAPMSRCIDRANA